MLGDKHRHALCQHALSSLAMLENSMMLIMNVLGLKKSE